MRIQPKVVELGHHRRELQALTGLNVEDAQARRLLNDIASFTAHFDLGREDRALVANRWLTQIYEPVTALVPPEARGKLEPAEFFHEVLVHRWYLSERAGPEVDIFDTARDYIDNVLLTRPDEVVAADPAGLTWALELEGRRRGSSVQTGAGPPAAAEVVAVGDEGAVAAVHGGAVAGGDGSAATSTPSSSSAAAREVTSARTSRVSASRLEACWLSEVIRASQAPK